MSAHEQAFRDSAEAAVKKAAGREDLYAEVQLAVAEAFVMLARHQAILDERAAETEVCDEV